MTDLRCIRDTSDKIISSKRIHTNELYTPLPKGRNQSSWDVLYEPHGQHSSSQKIRKEEISASLVSESRDASGLSFIL